MDIGAKLSRVMLHDMIDNSLRSNTSLQKAQRKDDKDKDEKVSPGKTASAASKGVGINASSVGNEDFSNMGDMRGFSSSQDDAFTSDNKKEKNKDDEEVDKSLEFFTKDRIYQFRAKHAHEEIMEKEEDFQQEKEKEKKEKEKKDNEKNKEKNEKEKKDEVLDGIKDREEEEKIILEREEKDIKDGDPKHRLKDRYSSSDDEKKEILPEEKDDRDIIIPHGKIQSSGLTMDLDDGVELQGSDVYEADGGEENVFFGGPSLYELEEEEPEEVSDDIKSSPEYIKEQNNRRRVRQMIVHFPSTAIAKRLVDELYVLGEKILETCLTFGIKIFILQQEEKLCYVVPGTEKIDSLRAGYSEDFKICFLGEEWLFENYQDLYRYKTSVYLMGLAFDHATGGDSFASLKSPFVLNNYHSCKRGEEGHLFIDGLSSHSPVEYFAQTMESFFQTEKDPLYMDLTQKVFEGKLCTREELYHTDISMYQYLDYLVNS